MKAINYDSDKLIKILEEKWSNAECVMCEENKWSASDEIMQLEPYQSDDDDLLVQPVIPITCNNCGFIILLSALTAGVIETPE